MIQPFFVFVCFGGARCSLGETYEEALMVVYKTIKPNDLFWLSYYSWGFNNLP